ncbi:MAG TPA: OmpH family outer membrane protein [Candidatus Ratteibacteria bacterium]|nr:OmpH family outer membrane protein [Candidatus Ratteibacteria bacterium]
MGKKDRVLLKFFLVIFILFFTKLSYSKELKVAVVNVEKIYGQYQTAQDSIKKIAEERTQKQIELSKKQAELKRLVDEYNAKKDKLKENEIKSYQKKIGDLQAEIKTFVQLTNNDLVKENQTKTQQFLEEIAKVIQEYAQNNGYDIIIDKKSLPYFSSSFDISDEIIKLLNNPQPKK